jgi:hypothetical protein
MISTLQTLRRHAAALFVTFHLVCVLVYALPRPPAANEAVLNHPEVKAELQNFPPELVEDLLTAVRAYVRVTDAARSKASPYLELAGSTQSWHMFGGTPPRFPLVFVAEVKPKNESEYILYQDLNWGTADSAAMNFRHRKVHENLCAWESGSMWDAYALYWAERWDREHPDRKCEKVRQSATRLTTPTPEQVRAGQADRQPKTGVDVHIWVRP